MVLNELIIGLILLPPFIGALFSWVADRIRSNSSRFLGITSIGLSALTNLIAFVIFLTGSWIPNSLDFTTLKFSNSLILVITPDALGIFMGLIAGFLGLLIAIFSFEYMDHDKHLSSYWFFFQLFIGGMVLLVLAGDLILMYVGWEIVGLSSYGLISHWRNKTGEKGRKAGLAGIKAFVFTRIGDIGFLVAIILIYKELGAVDFQTISESAPMLSSQLISQIGILFLMAGFAKSAQFPFIPWLCSPDSVDIDAMQGPTTVSALIHAATMVKAGVYLVSRIFLIIPLWRSTTFLWVLLITAGLTMLITALSAMTSFDLKRILAYSTISQLSYMFLGLGVAYISRAASDEELAMTAFLSVQFHLISHAIFKSLLFLSAGYLIHSFGSQDIRHLRARASWQNDRWSFLAFLVGGLALAGVVPLNGYFSKEAIIGSSFAGLSTNHYFGLYLFSYLAGVITAIFTAIYTTRLLYYLFFGEILQTEEHPSYTIMPSIMMILSVIALLAGLFQLFLPNLFNSLIGAAEFHQLFGKDIVYTMILTLLIPVVMFVTLKILGNDPLVKHITSLYFIRHVAIAARAGFYLEDLWQGGLYLVKQVSLGIRKTHTGSLNDMILGGLMVVMFVTTVVVGGLF